MPFAPEFPAPFLAPEFPAPFRYNGRLRFDQHECESYKRGLLGLPAVERDPQQPIRLIDPDAVASDLAIDRRTLGRRIRGRVRGEEAR